MSGHLPFDHYKAILFIDHYIPPLPVHLFPWLRLILFAMQSMPGPIIPIFQMTSNSYLTFSSVPALSSEGQKANRTDIRRSFRWAQWLRNIFEDLICFRVFFGVFFGIFFGVFLGVFLNFFWHSFLRTFRTFIQFFFLSHFVGHICEKFIYFEKNKCFYQLNALFFP